MPITSVLVWVGGTALLRTVLVCALFWCSSAHVIMLYEATSTGRVRGSSQWSCREASTVDMLTTQWPLLQREKRYSHSRFTSRTKHTHARTHTRTHARMHTHTHTHTLKLGTQAWNTHTHTQAQAWNTRTSSGLETIFIYRTSPNLCTVGSPTLTCQIQ